MIRLLLAAALVTLTLPTLAEAKGPKHCPPGLAKKNPSCVPPGLAKKGATYDEDRYEEEDDERYTDLRVGDRIVLNGDEYVVVSSGDTVVLRRDDDIYRLPRLDDGEDYVRIGDVLVKVDSKTKAVFDVIRLADLILS